MSNSDTQYIKAAIRWCELILSKVDINKTPIFLKAYSSLLYKSGQIDLAIKSLEKYLQLSPYPDSDAEKELEKMRTAN